MFISSSGKRTVYTENLQSTRKTSIPILTIVKTKEDDTGNQ